MEILRQIRAKNSYFLLLLSLLWITLLSSSISATSPLSQSDQGTEQHATSPAQDKSQVHEVHCSRERSRAAWKVVEEYLMPFVEKEKYELPRQCRLHPSNDLFRDQEEHKIHLDVNEWRCGYCRKSFRAEKFLDQHFDNRHSNLLDVGHSKCLADVCGALHCDLVMEIKSKKTKCNPAAAARNRHLCEGLADKCFPANQSPSSTHLHELFLRQFCDAHTCSGGGKPFSRGGKKHINRFYLAASILTLMLLPLFYLIVYLYQRHFLVTVHLPLLDDPRSEAEVNTFPPSAWYNSSGHLSLVSLDQPISLKQKLNSYSVVSILRPREQFS
ncbi:hypothetical protein KY290_019885 [Solanum tuberosum]|uniref:C2H2-type domain-containing protein n=1 Tax=Solanum tuberosum TaxID=4113 RepID=A0ABQ7VID3_SOLTU|nr:hypothetical protein KY284_018783 [Solanum tuberosum]KAH0691697.1 hypothetical protein KY289_019055 [Solanum tuberosum]KAH0763812.1 hypothetical protein KY290_019885 [Solanum tuberosum]